MFKRLVQGPSIFLTRPYLHFNVIEFPFYNKLHTDEEILEELKVQVEYVFAPGDETPFTLPVGQVVVNLEVLWDLLRVKQLLKKYEHLINFFKKPIAQQDFRLQLGGVADSGKNSQDTVVLLFPLEKFEYIERSSSGGSEFDYVRAELDDYEPEPFLDNEPLNTWEQNFTELVD